MITLEKVTILDVLAAIALVQASIQFIRPASQLYSPACIRTISKNYECSSRDICWRYCDRPFGRLFPQTLRKVSLKLQILPINYEVELAERIDTKTIVVI